MPRKSSFSKRIANVICARMAAGESLRQVCRDEAMPPISTVLDWVRKDADFAEQYARAREALQEHWAEEILDVADDGSNDWIKREHESGRIDQVPNAEHINRSRLRVDARKWLLSKLAPKKYGDRVALEHGGPDGSPLSPPVIGITFTAGGPGCGEKPPNDDDAGTPPPEAA